MTFHQINRLPELPQRPEQGHKGTFGRVLIVAGSYGMSGAAALCGLGALRGGAGLVDLAIPRSILPSVAAIEPSYLTLPLEDQGTGQLIVPALPQIRSAISGKNAIAIGPGLGQSDEITQVVTTLYEETELPLLIDADGLNALAKSSIDLRQHAGPRVLTPHPGEFARLTQLQTAEVQANRQQLAVEFAAQHDVLLVLKGKGTVVTDGVNLYVNTTGNSGLGTGGTGDVLTGLIAALLAQGMTPFDAAQLGVFLHGRAGDLAAEELSQPGLIASDLPRFIGPAWLSLIEE